MYQTSLVDMLGELDLLTAGPDDLDMAQEYLLFLLDETEEPEILRVGLAEYQEIHRFFAPDASLSQRFPDLSLSIDGDYWLVVKDGDARARALYERHYSAKPNLERRRRRNTKLFVGPGEKLVLLTPKCDALFIWRREKVRLDNQYGANVAAFRNESDVLSSDLILAAELFARRKWPDTGRFFTYINQDEIRSTNPGYCFIKAGWRKCGRSAKGLVMLEKLMVRGSFHLPWTPWGSQ